MAEQKKPDPPKPAPAPAPPPAPAEKSLAEQIAEAEERANQAQFHALSDDKKAS